MWIHQDAVGHFQRSNCKNFLFTLNANKQASNQRKYRKETFSIISKNNRKRKMIYQDLITTFFCLSIVFVFCWRHWPDRSRFRDQKISPLFSFLCFAASKHFRLRHGFIHLGHFFVSYERPLLKLKFKSFWYYLCHPENQMYRPTHWFTGSGRSVPTVGIRVSCLKETHT